MFLSPKEEQKYFIANTLKPLFKKWGYKNSGQNWWKFQDDFFHAINLQNSRWNTKDSIDFCFNFGTGLTKDVANKRVTTYHDGLIFCRQNAFFTNRKSTGTLGYLVDQQSDCKKVFQQVINDLALTILPKLETLNSKKAILEFYKSDWKIEKLRAALKA